MKLLSPPVTNSQTIVNWDAEILLGTPFSAAGHAFCLNVYPKGNPEQDGAVDSHISAYLGLHKSRISTKAGKVKDFMGPKALFSLSASTGEQQLAGKETAHMFSSKEPDWGFTQLCQIINLPTLKTPTIITVTISQIEPHPQLDQCSAHIAAKQAAVSFADFYKQPAFADCTLHIGPHAAHQCHRMVLAASSKVFNAMFTSSMQEAATREVAIEETDSGTLDLMLQYMYGMAVEVPLPLVLPLLALADRYGCSDLHSELGAWMKGEAFSNQALAELLPQATLLGLDAVADDLMDAILQYPGFYAGPDDLMKLVADWRLEDVALLVRRAKGSFGALEVASCWVSSDMENRHGSWGQLLPLVNFSGMSFKELASVRRMQAAINADGLRDRLLDAWEAKTL